MKPIFRNLFLSLGVAMLAASSASAQTTYTWTQTVGGAQSWTTPGNWSAGVPSPISGDTIDFSTVNIAANTAVTLEADRTAELWKFGDTTGSTTWTVNAGNLITLAGTTPTIQVNNGTVILKNEVAGTQGLTKTGNGILQLNAVNSFTGNTVISAGTLQLGTNNNSGTLGPATYNGNITIATGALLDMTNSDSQTFNGIISGGGNLVKRGGGTLTLAGDNTYTGRTIIGGGGGGGRTVVVSSFNSINADETGATMASSSLGAPTTIANGKIELGSGGNVRSSALTYTGSGETTNRVMLVSFNSGSGHKLTSNATGGGLLKFTSAFRIDNSTGTTGSSFTLQGTGDGEISAGMNAEDAAMAGTLIKAGTGTWTLGGTSGANALSVTGGTLINNGTFNVTTSVTVNNTTTLTAGHIIANSASFGATSNTNMGLGGTTLGAEYDNITLDAAGALVYGGNLNIVNDGAYDMDASSFTYDLFAFDTMTPTGDFNSVTVNSILLLNSGGLWTGANGDTTYSFDQALGDLTVTAIPEPSVALLGGLGLLALLRRRRA